MRELLQEIWASIRRNKLRTFLTGFSVAWGIFMLIVLLGSGNGLQNGVTSNFEGRAMNYITAGGGWTQIAYQGFQQGRRIRLKIDDMKYIQEQFPDEITNVTASLSAGNNSNMSYKDNYVAVNIDGIFPGFEATEQAKITSGRGINNADIQERRKVAVIDKTAQNALFPHENPIGKMVTINGIGYMVVGTYSTLYDWGSSYVYIPLTTMTAVYYGGEPLVNRMVMYTKGIDTRQQSQEFVQKVRTALAGRHSAHPNDTGAIWAWSMIEESVMFQTIFGGISMFIWVIGIGTLIAGIVGVGNIMLVTVRERTNEFGIRKALGARPLSLINLVLVESIMITGFFGYIGMIGGIGVMEIVNYVIENRPTEETVNNFNIVMFKNPTLELPVIFTATLVLIVAGLIAGYVPARRASRLRTIDAMRHNK